MMPFGIFPVCSPRSMEIQRRPANEKSALNLVSLWTVSFRQSKKRLLHLGISENKTSEVQPHSVPRSNYLRFREILKSKTCDFSQVFPFFIKFCFLFLFASLDVCKYSLREGTRGLLCEHRRRSPLIPLSLVRARFSSQIPRHCPDYLLIEKTKISALNQASPKRCFALRIQ